MGKLIYRDAYLFGEGLKAGALDYMLETAASPEKARRHLAMRRKYEWVSFDTGYRLGYQESYSGAYKRGVDRAGLMAMAVELGDVEPIGWHIYRSFQACFIEENGLPAGAFGDSAGPS